MGCRHHHPGTVPAIVARTAAVVLTAGSLAFAAAGPAAADGAEPLGGRYGAAPHGSVHADPGTVSGARRETGPTEAVPAGRAAPLAHAARIGHPAPGPPRGGPSAAAGEERLWLLGALTVALAATALVARAAMRGRRD
ncbi:hypothetical protein [Streptomyces sp. NPDC051180]|uniref:hypothetical protein n=1 Tax=unclassified Streptomyces TaxID=2593676 RepID=UPI00344D367B